jgi:hypothetical protein
LYSAVLNGRVTEVLDMDWVVGALDRETRRMYGARRSGRVVKNISIANVPAFSMTEVHGG